MPTHELTQVEARRIAVRAQLLDQPRPTSLLDVVRRLTLVQADQTAAVAPSADLVLWSRLGAAYRPQHLESALGDQALLEVQGMIRHAEDLALYRADMADWPGRGELLDWQRHRRDWLAANRGFRLDVLSRLRSDGPLPARELPDTCDVSWSSSGWSNDRNVLKMLELLEAKGEVAMAGRDGRERLWDLAERIYPDDDVVDAEQAALTRAERRLRALGIARVTRQAGQSPNGPEVGEPAVVQGVRGRWRVDPAQLGQPFTGRAALLSPLDRLVFDRKRLSDLFGFDYQLEMYKPAAKRRWGYWAMPILYGDQLVGKLDATADRRAGVLRVDAVHQDVPFSKAMAAAVDREIADLAAWLGLHLDLPTG
ncbi:crosslink repair DNA glycosylase YcaQ family protein [Catellatospora sp. KI3]|uniref:DNA glycosylase AlkZ-like family protein n=1 Tax=Catellatospora sp. KI3 TaxID=3041620 RepID=UPI0024827DC4|nr:crosslink repair DNA glycosylase YcaQ family protein [Catellatospora sp. KI3]MDI1465195.1 crosslink repair DNA glycosylase YcaQ family protein [Catellatospora sp. KI3]